MTAWRLVRVAALVPAPWRNGLGTSWDIAGALAPDGVPLWQVSIAALEHDAAFSHYPHCDRVFTPIAGDPPPELAFHDGPFEPCPLLHPRRFPGDVPTRSRIPAPGRAFNAIVDRRRYEVAVTVARLAPAEPLPIPPSAHAVLHCLDGALSLEGLAAAPGDSLAATPAAGPATASATAAAVAILVSITPRH